nr:Crp/Fnr family transcriptional regulator [Sphingobium sp. BHU LFT2]
MVLSACRDIRPVSRRRDIISDGESPEFLHVVIEGWAARYKILKDGSRRITAFMLPGDFCDLHATLLDAMDHAIVAVTNCQIAYIANEEIDRITRLSATLARAFWRATLVDEAILRQWLVNSGRRNAFDAVAHLLCELHFRSLLIGLGTDRVALPLTQEDLADACGLTPVHVNRMLQRMRREGLIEMAGGELCVPDIRALRQSCGFEPDYFHLKLSTDYPSDRPEHAGDMTMGTL